MMLKKSKEKDLSSILATSEALPFRPGTLDFAYMITVIEFLADPRPALSSIGAALKQKAPLVIEFINRESAWGEMYSKKAEGGDLIFSNAQLYTLMEISSILRDAGFTVLDLVGTLYSPPDECPERIELTQTTTNAGVIVVKAEIAPEKGKNIA
jgi:SAM-dependent methyltransferase